MCRLTIYKGKTLLLGELIVKPSNSIICQSRDAVYHPGVKDNTHVRNIRVNGDGCGIAFYGPNPTMGACVFKFVTPAWSNKNLRNLGEYVHSNLIMAHVRAASSGHDPHEQVAVSIENCHPFKHGRWSFMHNGGIPQFRKIKRSLLNLLSQEIFNDISGSTDSEHIFALFLNFLSDRDSQLSLEEITSAIEKTISTIIDLCGKAGMNEPCSLNLCATDGTHIVATRFRNASDCPPSLYYSFGSSFKCADGKFENIDPALASDIVISSAPLCKLGEEEDGEDCDETPEKESVRRSRSASKSFGSYHLIPRNHMLVCRGDLADISRIVSVRLEPINWSIPSDPSDLISSPTIASQSVAPHCSKFPSPSASPSPSPSPSKVVGTSSPPSFESWTKIASRDGEHVRVRERLPDDRDEGKQCPGQRALRFDPGPDEALPFLTHSAPDEVPRSGCPFVVCTPESSLCPQGEVKARREPPLEAVAASEDEGLLVPIKGAAKGEAFPALTIEDQISSLVTFCERLSAENRSLKERIAKLEETKHIAAPLSV